MRRLFIALLLVPTLSIAAPTIEQFNVPATAAPYTEVTLTVKATDYDTIRIVDTAEETPLATCTDSPCTTTQSFDETIPTRTLNATVNDTDGNTDTEQKTIKIGDCGCTDPEGDQVPQWESCHGQDVYPYCTENQDQNYCYCKDYSPGDEEDDDPIQDEDPLPNPDASQITHDTFALCSTPGQGWENNVTSGGLNIAPGEGGALACGTNTTWYCTAPGNKIMWTKDLDINSTFADACDRYASGWTGNYCCGEADDTNETYNDVQPSSDTAGACLLGTKYSDGTTLRNNTVLVHNGTFFSCNATGPIQDYDSAPNKSLQQTDGNLTNESDWCTTYQGYYCSQANGNWTKLSNAVAGQCAKVGMNKKELGACPEQDQCYVDQENGCIESGEWREDSYCDGGNWTTRTGRVAKALLNIVRAKDAVDARLRCDAAKNALVDKTGSADTYGYCALWYQDNTEEYVVLGASINEEQTIDSYLTTVNQTYRRAMNITWDNPALNELPSATCEGTRGWEECVSSEQFAFHYDNETHTAIFSVEPEGIEQSWFQDLQDTLWSWAQTIFGNAPEPISDPQQGLRDFDKIYLEQNNDYRVQVIKESAYDPQTDEKRSYITADYPGSVDINGIAQQLDGTTNVTGTTLTVEYFTDADWQLLTEVRLQ